MVFFQKEHQNKRYYFSAGVLGTIPLLLKLKDTTLPNLSPKLGRIVRTNNESLVVNVSQDKSLDLSKGLAIGSIMEVDEDSHLETCRYGKGSNFWRYLMLPMIPEEKTLKRLWKLMIQLFSPQ